MSFKGTRVNRVCVGEPNRYIKYTEIVAFCFARVSDETFHLQIMFLLPKLGNDSFCKVYCRKVYKMTFNVKAESERAERQCERRKEKSERNANKIHAHDTQARTYMYVNIAYTIQ